MEITYNRKDNNGTVRTYTIESETKKECYEEIYKHYNRGRYTTQLLWLDENNDDFWKWVRSLTIGEYYKFNGQED